jgi:hypothetical protein
MQEADDASPLSMMAWDVGWGTGSCPWYVIGKRLGRDEAEHR